MPVFGFVFHIIFVFYKKNGAFVNNCIFPLSFKKKCLSLQYENDSEDIQVQTLPE